MCTQYVLVLDRHNKALYFFVSIIFCSILLDKQKQISSDVKTLSLLGVIVLCAVYCIVRTPLQQTRATQEGVNNESTRCCDVWTGFNCPAQDWFNLLLSFLDYKGFNLRSSLRVYPTAGHPGALCYFLQSRNYKHRDN